LVTPKLAKEKSRNEEVLKFGGDDDQRDHMNIISQLAKINKKMTADAERQSGKPTAFGGCGGSQEPV
jgi:hypothetical protein